MHLETGTVPHQPGDIAVRIVEIAEFNRIRHAGGGTGRGIIRIHAGGPAQLNAFVNTFNAKGAFLGDTKAFILAHHPLLDGLGAVIPLLVMDDGARLVGTGHGAIAAPQTEIIIHGHQTVRPLSGRAGGTYRDAGGPGAVLASNHQKLALHIRITAVFDIQYAAPLYSGGGIVTVLAGDGAGLAADTAVQVNHHAPARRPVCPVHAGRFAPAPLRMLTRARSALLPVESVNARAMDERELRLGSPRSFAKGVAQ